MGNRASQVTELEAITPRRLYRQVADQLRSLIEAGHFPIGSRLPTERELAVQLGISRPTVREALIALEVDGFVRIRVGSGIYVLPPSADRAMSPPVMALAGPFDILKARALFEGAIAEEAARLATPLSLAPVNAALQEMREADHPGPQSIWLDRAFHTAVANILGNDAITAVVGDLFDQRINPHFAKLAQYFENSNSWRAALNEHELIRDCLATGDTVGAMAAMRSHLQHSQDRFFESFGESMDHMPKSTGADGAQPRRSRVPTAAHTPATSTKSLPNRR
ncbi:FadR Transcriptional regulators [Rhabdaerophilaceae bacterium]